MKYFKNLATLLFILLPSVCLADSAKLTCQFIPYTHCAYEVELVLVNYENDILDNQYSIEYEGDNIEFHPGLYSHTVQLDDTIVINNVGLRIRDGRITFNKRYNQEFFKKLMDFTGKDFVLKIQSQRIPLLIEDLDLPTGWIYLNVFKNKESKSMVAASSIRMKPTNGCWLDEHSCVNYPD